jgi:hypothetical protein
MVVFYKNYKRTERVLLSIQSVKYLFPDIKVYCLLLFDKDKREYDSYVETFNKLGVSLFFDKKKYNFGNLSAQGSVNNGFYFTEGINKIQKICVDIDINQNVLILDEDHFFTTGKTINFLLNETFDLAIGTWPAPDPVIYKKRPVIEPNASIVCMNPVSLNEIFPITPMHEYVEILFGFELVEKSMNLGKIVKKIPTRDYTNFHDDGIHTNNIEEIKTQLTLANIPLLYE